MLAYNCIQSVEKYIGNSLISKASKLGKISFIILGGYTIEGWLFINNSVFLSPKVIGRCA